MKTDCPPRGGNPVASLKSPARAWSSIKISKWYTTQNSNWPTTSRWDEYDGISNHKKILDSNANFEQFEVDNPEKKLHIKGQTLRLYNPDSHQWSIYLVDVDKGTLDLPPVVGRFSGTRGEFYNQQQYKGRAILVRYIWLNISPKSARMETILFAWRRENMGNKLDLRADSIARPWAS
jgi:hypothetical protein